MAELAEAAALAAFAEGARFAALELGAGSEVPVPCWVCGVAAFSLCVFDEDGGVWAGSTLALSAEAFVFGVRWKNKSRSDLGRSVSCGEFCGFCCNVVDEGKGAGETLIG